MPVPIGKKEVYEVVIVSKPGAEPLSDGTVRLASDKKAYGENGTAVADWIVAGNTTRITYLDKSEGVAELTANTKGQLTGSVRRGNGQTEQCILRPAGLAGG